MEEADLLKIEGLAMIGMIVDARIEKNKKGARLLVKTRDGKLLASPYDEPGVIAKSYFIVRKYMEWGSLINRNR